MVSHDLEDASPQAGHRLAVVGLSTHLGFTKRVTHLSQDILRKGQQLLLRVIQPVDPSFSLLRQPHPSLFQYRYIFYLSNTLSARKQPRSVEFSDDAGYIGRIVLTRNPR